MASIQDAIKRLSWMFTSTGADKVAADHNKVAESSEALAVKSQKTEKSALDLDKAFAGLERRFDTTIRAQQDYQKVQDKVNAAVAQHPELQARANNVLALAAEHFDKAKGSAGGFSAVLDAGRGAALGYATGLGGIGAVLGSFGPWGIAAAAGIAIVSNAVNYLSEAAAKAGDEASALKRFADVSGLTTIQVRGVTEAGQELGVGADTISGALQKFTINLDEARKGGGALFDQLQRLDAKLADDIASSRSSGDALDLLTKAYKRTTDATMQAALAKAAFGKGGASVGPVLGVIAEGGGLDKYSEQAAKDLGITKEWTDAVARLRNANKDLADDIKTIESVAFSKELLERQNTFLKQQLIIAKIAAETAEAAKTYLKSGSGGPQADEFGNQFDFTLLNKNREAEKPFAVGGDPVADISAIEAATKATEDLTAARLEAANAERTAATDAAGTVTLLGAAASGAEIAAANFHKLTAAFLENKFGAAESAEAMEKYQRALRGGLDNAVAALQEQRTVIEAVGGAAKMAAQYWADYNAEMRKVGDETAAAAIASEKMATSQAAANAAAKDSIQSMKDANELAKARTVQEERSIAAQQKYNEVLKATGVPLLAEEAKLQVIEKYNIQIDNAARKRVGTYEAAADAAQREADAAAAAYQAQADADYKASQAAGGPFGGAADNAAFGNNTVPSGQTYTSTSNLGVAIMQAYERQKSIQPYTPQSFQEIADASLSGGVDHAISSLQGMGPQEATKAEVAQTWALGMPVPYSYFGVPDIQTKTAGSAITESQIVSTVSSLYDLKTASATTNADKAANLNAELAWLQTRPETIARDQKINQLIQSINNLNKTTDNLSTSTDSLNSTMGDMLSPYYNEDPRTSHIGFRQGFASGGEFTVPGGMSANDNMTATLPVASGEIVSVRRPSAGSGGGTQRPIVINMPVTIQGGANRDEIGRTLFQSGQAMAKQIRTAGG